MATIDHINRADVPDKAAFSQAVAVRGVGGVEEAVAAFAAVWGQRGDPPAITLAVAEALANRLFRIEIEAIAGAGGR